MDKRMFCLFINKKSNPKEPFEALRENNLNNNKNNSNEFQWIYPRDKCLLDKRNQGIENSRGGKDLNFFKRNYESYYSKSHRRVQLVNLWDKCLIHQHERVGSADEVYELLSQEVSRLQELYVKCAKIYRWMLERQNDQIRKKGIQPISFFQSSFQLLEEENEENLVGPI
ncbi:hypothetical protein Glove_71g58 [Diversispora epigaea]|uniref:Uncharacterized protein n=1 Tax=Diversispora epigaea TaxID=1348612 RepID=A0A397JKR8_9GLOM|nr:hypothetical protein Glove_71g58 [Diversispora epigaea]